MDWYPWYPGLYRAATMHLSLAEDGAYRRLIDHYMETRQPLPDDDAALARIVGCGVGEWTILRVKVRAFFTSDAGLLRLKRCDFELEEQDARSQRLSQLGKKGMEARWRKNNDLITPAITPAITPDITQDKTRQYKTEESKKEPAAQENCASPAPMNGAAYSTLPQCRSSDDPAILLFEAGVAYLMHATGRPKRPLHAVIGKWLQANGQNHAAIYQLLQTAEVTATADPIAWVSAALKGKPHGRQTFTDANARAQAKLDAQIAQLDRLDEGEPD